jgi:predicted Zn-dependent protease
MKRVVIRFGATALLLFSSTPNATAQSVDPARATAQLASAGYWKTRYAPAQLKQAAHSLNSDYLGETTDRARWAQPKIRVCVDFSHVQKLKWVNEKLFAAKVQQCMDNWNEALDGKFQFETIADKHSADIYIKFDSYRYNQPASIAGFTQCRGEPEGTHAIRSADVAILVIDGQGGRSSNNQIERTIYHEFGHALGLEHSANDEDIMYPRSHVSTLSPRDRNSVRKLYGLST